MKIIMIQSYLQRLFNIYNTKKLFLGQKIIKQLNIILTVIIIEKIQLNYRRMQKQKYKTNTNLKLKLNIDQNYNNSITYNNTFKGKTVCQTNIKSQKEYTKKQKTPKDYTMFRVSKIISADENTKFIKYFKQSHLNKPPQKNLQEVNILKNQYDKQPIKMQRSITLPKISKDQLNMAGTQSINKNKALKISRKSSRLSFIRSILAEMYQNNFFHLENNKISISITELEQIIYYAIQKNQHIQKNNGVNKQGSNERILQYSQKSCSLPRLQRNEQIDSIRYQTAQISNLKQNKSTQTDLSLTITNQIYSENKNSSLNAKDNIKIKDKKNLQLQTSELKKVISLKSKDQQLKLIKSNQKIDKNKLITMIKNNVKKANQLLNKCFQFKKQNCMQQLQRNYDRFKIAQIQQKILEQLQFFHKYIFQDEELIPKLKDSFMKNVISRVLQNPTFSYSNISANLDEKSYLIKHEINEIIIILRNISDLTGQIQLQPQQIQSERKNHILSLEQFKERAIQCTKIVNSINQNMPKAQIIIQLQKIIQYFNNSLGKYRQKYKQNMRLL